MPWIAGMNRLLPADRVTGWLVLVRAAAACAISPSDIRQGCRPRELRDGKALRCRQGLWRRLALRRGRLWDYPPSWLPENRCAWSREESAGVPATHAAETRWPASPEATPCVEAFLPHARQSLSPSVRKYRSLEQFPLADTPGAIRRSSWRRSRRDKPLILHDQWPPPKLFPILTS